MNPALNVLSLPAGNARQGTNDAGAIPLNDTGTFAQLLGQVAPALEAPAADDKPAELLHSDSGAINNLIAVPTQTVPQGDAVTPLQAEPPLETTTSEATLVAGLLEQMLAASNLLAPALPIAKSISTVAAGVSPLDTTASAGSVATPTPATPPEVAPLPAATAVNVPNAASLMALSEAPEAAEATNIAFPTPMPQATAMMPTPSGVNATATPSAMTGEQDMAKINPQSANAADRPVPTLNPTPSDAAQAMANTADNPVALAALFERALIERGAARAEPTALRELAALGASQIVHDLARGDHDLPPGLSTNSAASRVPLSMTFDGLSANTAVATDRTTLIDAPTTTLIAATRGVRSFGYPDGRGDDIVGPAAAATIAPAVRSDTVPQLAIAPRMDTPEWQPAFARSVKMLVSDGTPAASLQLNPAEFGPIDVRIVINDRRADISFLVTNPNADAALQSALPELRDQLARSGIQLGQTSVGTQSQEYRQPADTPRREPTNSTTATPSASTTLPVRPRSTNQIDTFA